MTGWPIRVGILGAGAMGTLFAHGIASHTSSEVWLCARQNHPETVQVEGGPSVPVRLAGLGERMKDLDLLLVTVKAYDTRCALDGLIGAGGVGPSTLVLTLQNGLGNAETIAGRVGPERTLCGVTAQGATLLAPGLVRHGGRGPTELGTLAGTGGDAPARRVADWLTGAGLPAAAVPDYRVPLWSKLAVNCAINPLTALLRIPNGELLRRPAATALMEAAAHEVARVARAEGIPLERDPAEHARTVAAASASNRSSMLQDVERGRRTEVDAISGAVASLGNRHGLPTPVNATLAALVRSLEP